MYFDFQIFLISLARSCYLSYFSVSFCCTLHFLETAVSTLIFFFCLLSFNYNVWPPVVDFTVCFTSSFSSMLLGEYSYHLSLYSTPHSLHTFSCMTDPTTSCLFLYSVWASLGQLHKICYVLLSSSFLFFFSLL